jgi:hypothetical protein
MLPAYFIGRRSVARAVYPAGGFWVAWPKQASKVPTDLTEDVLREVALPRGLVDNKVCAVTEVWSGLRLVWRREHRAGARAQGPPAARTGGARGGP